jgi:hypothetical protein
VDGADYPKFQFLYIEGFGDVVIPGLQPWPIAAPSFCVKNHGM